MTQILRSISLTTKFQILVEVAANQPDIQQRDIAERLDLSPQAVSDYVKELIQSGWLITKGRSKYQVTPEGVDWMLKGLREWHNFSDTVQKAIASLSVSAAVADSEISKDQNVGLLMRDGLLFATQALNTEATGIAVSDARKGDDVGITNINGIVPLEVGKVTVVRLASIQRGGSRNTDLTTLQISTKGKKVIGAIGIEALTALRKIDVEPTFLYGVREAVAEAARSGLSPVVVCVDNDTSDLLRRLEEHGIDYEIVDARKPRPA
ncbi:MAG: winged helix-turn-helix transcriptional regulator [Chloroflexota bacterium]|nr:winged helix-turn-helix transcriptional regulator [Chloroflexota bacterium]